MKPNAPFLMNETIAQVVEHFFIQKNETISLLKEQTLKMPERKMRISDDQGAFLSFLVNFLNCEKILEIGTYTGTSTLYMAQALSGIGEIITIDRNPEWTKVAQKYWSIAGVSHKIKLHIGDAVQELEKIENDCFDLVFIDADKKNYPFYYKQALRTLKRNGSFIIDNIFLNGKLELNSDESLVKKMCQFYDELKQDDRVKIVFLPFYDGMLWGQKL